MIRLAEVICLFQNGDPGKPGLIDLQDETLEEQVIILQRESVLGIMVGYVEGIFWMRDTVITIAGQCWPPARNV